MKTKLATLLLCMFFVLHGNAQSDSFFNYQTTEGGRYNTPVPFNTNEGQGIQNMNINATPTGSGTAILMATSLLYVALRRKEEEK